jgi:putative transposase
VLPVDEETALRAQLRTISATWPRYGFRRAWALLRAEGVIVNRKRIQRLWRDEGLRVPQHTPKRRRLGASSVPAERLTATHPNHVWALDFLFDTTSDRRPFKVLAMCDEFTRESIGGRLGRSITADDVVAVLDDAMARRGAPRYIRCDNGPEFTAAAIRDWCNLARTGTAFIEPGSPWQTPWIESFNGKARDELFAREVFGSIMEARLLYNDWRDTYNCRRPHSSLNWLPPAQFAACWQPPIHPEPSDRVDQ